MKTKFSKRMLSGILALIMVICSVPFMGISAAAEDKEPLDQLYDACLDYSAMMRNLTVVKTNMLQAYDAYTDARKYYDLTKIGVYDGSEALAKKAALEAAISRMGDYTPNVTLATTAADNSYTTDVRSNLPTLVAGDQMSNVLYTYGVGSSSNYNGTTASNMTTGIQMGPVVFLYNEGLMAVPVNVYASKSGTSTRRARFIYPTGDFYLNKMWHGYSTNAGYTTATDNYLGYVDGDQDHFTNNSSTTSYYSNTLYYRGTLPDNEYVRTLYPNWNWQNNQGTNSSFAQSAPIYIINYKVVNDRIKLAAENMSGINLLATEAARDFLGDVDALIAINFNPDYNSDVAGTVSNLEATIRSAVEDFDASDYSQAGLMYSLSDMIGVTKPVFDAGNSDGLYTTTSWNTYVSAYNAAYNAVAAVQNNGYTLPQDTVDILLKNLENAIAGLTYADKELADTTEFDRVEAYAHSLSAIYYTDSYAELLRVVEEQTAIVYPNGRVKAPVTKDEQDKVDAATAAIWEAIANLRLTSRGLEALLEEAKTYDPNEWLGYARLQEAMAQAEDYIVEMADRVFPATPDNYETAEADEYAKYQDVCNELRAAINALYRAFTRIENGTVISETVGNTGGVNQDNVTVYLNQAIIQRTYFKTLPGTQTFVTEYDLTIDNTFRRNLNYYGAQFHGLGFGALGVDVYAPNNLGSMAVTWLEGGAEGVELSSTYHRALMKTSVTTGTDYINIVSNTTGQKILGQTTVTANNLGLAQSTWTTPDIYELFYVSGAASGSQTKNVTNANVKQSITVIDVSSLFSLIDRAHDLMDKAYNNYYECYNATAWKAFADALAAAKENMDYENMSNDAIVSECQNRYDALEKAMNTLSMSSSINQDVTKHKYDTVIDNQPSCTTGGHQTDTCSICGFVYSHDLDPLQHDYVYTSDNNGRTHTESCSRNDIEATSKECVDNDSNDYCDLCGQYLYEPAIWEAYNSAQENLIAALLGKNSIESVQAVKNAVDAMSYFAYSKEQKAATAATEQTAIDAEVAKIIEALDLLQPVDSSVYDALSKTVDTLNADAYNIEAVQGVRNSASTSQQFTIADEVYYGYEFEEAITQIKTAMTVNQYEYHVIVYDFSGEYPYYLTNEGTYVQGSFDGEWNPVAPAGAGVFHYGDFVTTANPVSAEEICTWSVEIIAKSTQTTSTYKYMRSDSSYQFNVRGETTLYTSAGDTSSSIQVKFIDGRNNHVVGVEYVTKGRNTMAELSKNVPAVPFYAVLNYTNTTTNATVAPAATVTINADTTYIINYSTSSQVGTYSINLKNSSGNAVDGYPISANYNDLITISVDNAAAFVNTETDKVIAYGSTYSFYACESLDIQAVESVENEDVYVSVVKPVVTNGKAYFIGSFAAPASCTVESYGVVIDTTGKKDTLSLADVNKADNVFNLSASKLTCGNQFVLSASLNNSAGTNVKYVAYTIYTVNGLKLIAYSDIVSATLS